MYIAYMYMHISYINNINNLLDISANNRYVFLQDFFESMQLLWRDFISYIILKEG